MEGVKSGFSCRQFPGLRRSAATGRLALIRLFFQPFLPRPFGNDLLNLHTNITQSIFPVVPIRIARIRNQTFTTFINRL